MAVHSKKSKQEQIDFVARVLGEYGIKKYEVGSTKSNHIQISFDFNGQRRTVVIAASGDHRARLRNRSIVRGILEGRR